VDDRAARPDMRGMTHPARPRRPAAALDLPPSFRDARGAARRVGVEVECTDLGARAAALALAAGLGGTAVEERDPHAFRVRGTRLGDLAVELDLRHAHPRAHADTLPFRLGPRAAAWLGSALGPLVPRELVTAPLPAARLAEVDEAVDVLRRAGAGGRGTTWSGSLGLHLNVDPPGLDAGTLAAFLRAFVLLEPRLRREAVGDAPPRWWRPAFLPAPFPAGYARLVLAPGYRPDLAGLAGDYLAANPTRDRGLDLLPVLLHLDPARVRARLPREKIGARPALHYRLPRARVGEAGWGIVSAWDGWAAVERLAGDPDRLAALARAYPGHAEAEAEAEAARARRAGPGPAASGPSR
jgi:hypothetical protein